MRGGVRGHREPRGVLSSDFGIWLVFVTLIRRISINIIIFSLQRRVMHLSNRY